MIVYLFASLGCNTPEGFKVYNSDPTANIYSHESPLQVEEGSMITFTAALSDDNHFTEELTASWVRINVDNQSLDMCPPAGPDENGDTVVTRSYHGICLPAPEKDVNMAMS